MAMVAGNRRALSVLPSDACTMQHFPNGGTAGTKPIPDLPHREVFLGEEPDSFRVVYFLSFTG